MTEERSGDKDRAVEKKENERRVVERVLELSFVKCPTHGIRYPAGATCPQCARER